ncbi:ComEA family DNA-binding protein [Leptothrix discophora]|uniref:Helix-hairpin-helix domain-containing protein n=1 Tax=Leptothrix discophora TaxID=89 RepID=A0ABT9G688_LEPDI|nr:helix-hairpin-helix domain-containing protein [Leptothrix discophora]MDP4302001.1 helix-hairpin-helix domain-containing protein [Leptothrix discophora]
MFKFLIATLLALFTGLSMAAVDLNKGSQAELESVKGIGPAMSGRILDERKKSVFKDWDDFMSRVKGVKTASATRFSAAGLTVNGTTYPGGAGGAAAKPDKADKSDKAAKK